jgi:hypothetical protein
MKRITATALFTLAALVTAGGAMAQDRAVRATLPFDFTAGDRLLPAGNYEISSVWSNVIEIRNRDKGTAIMVTTTYDSHESRNGSKLVFDRLGDQYFLREVLAQAAAINVNLPPTKAEKHAQLQVAALQKPTQVEVATK